MAQSKEAETASSLQRLTALRSTSNTGRFLEQVRQAAQIVGVSLDSETLSLSHDGALERRDKVVEATKQRHHGRAEWVLRWLLDKLKAEEVTRATPESWVLLEKIICLVPVSNVARQLDSYHFLNTLENTLREAIPTAKLEEEARPGPVDGLSAVHDNTKLDLVSIGLSRKRRRDGTLVEGTALEEDDARTEPGVHPIAKLFNSVNCVLKRIDSFTKPQALDKDVIMCQHMQSVLRTDAPQAARILGLWMRLQHALLCPSALPLVAHGIAPILHIWDQRSIDSSSDTDTSSILFSSECLVSAMRLLSTLSKSVPRTAINSSALNSSARQQISILAKQVEQLLARHILLPAHATHFAAGADGVATSLHRLVEPLRLPQSDTTEPKVAIEHQLNLDISEFPLLLDVSLRCVSRSTPSKRHTEAPWIEYVFTCLADIVGTPVTETKPKTPISDGLAKEIMPPRESRQEAVGSWTSKRPQRFEDQRVLGLQLMLQVLLEHNASLATQTLTNLAVSYSRVFECKAWDIRWNFLAVIHQLDTSVLLGDTNRAADKDLPPALPQVVFEKISTVPVDLPPGYANSQHSSDRDSNLGIVNLIVLPLLDAYAKKGRNLVGFVTQWHAQLAKLCEAGCKTNGAAFVTLRTAWESSDLSAALRALLESSLTGRQISQLLELHLENLTVMLIRLRAKPSSMSGENDDTSVRADAYASLTLSDAILGAICSDETTDLIQRHLPIFSTTIESLLEFPSFSSLIDLSVVWRLMTRTLQLQSVSFSSASTEDRKALLKRSLVKLAQKSIAEQTIKIPPAGLSYAAEYEAFRLIFSLCDAALGDDELQSRISKHLTHATDLLLRLPKIDRNGNNASLTSVIVEHSTLIRYLDKDNQELLFRSIYSNATSCYPLHHAASEGREERITPMLLLADLCESILSSALDETKYILLGALYASYVTADGQDGSSSSPSRNLSTLAESIFTNLPTSALFRRWREDVLNHVVRSLGDSGADTNLVASDPWLRLSVIAKLMEVPNPTADICLIPDVLMHIARITYAGSDEEIPRVLAAQKEVFTLTLKHVTSPQEWMRSQKYCQALWSKVQHLISSVESFVHDLGKLALVQAFFAVFDKDPVRSMYLLQLEGSAAARVKYFKAVGISLGTLIREFGSDVGVGTNQLNALLDAVIDLLPSMFEAVSEELKEKQEGNVEERTGDMSTLISSLLGAALGLAKEVEDEHAAEQADGEFILHEYYVRALGAWELSRATLDQTVPDLAHTFLPDDALLEAFHDLILACSKSSQYKPSSCVRFYAILSNFDISHKEPSKGARSTALAKRILARDILPMERAQVLDTFQQYLGHRNMDEKAAVLDRLLPRGNSETTEILHTLLNRLCQQLVAVDSKEDFLSLTSCIATILREKFIVTQWGIDTLVSTLSITASRCGPSLSADHAGHTFKQLCSLTRSLISLHRTKLGGRFHLLVPLLQNLLNCLFTPDARSSTHTLPPWLSPKVKTLGPEHAAAYARVLTTLCSPTVSSVSHSRKRQRNNTDLTDETKKARACAGQYVQYVLTEYCACQLRGRLGEGVREKLIPGLWAMLDVIGKDGIKAMSAGMDGSGRAVLRGLWEEWRRFGDGKGSRVEMSELTRTESDAWVFRKNTVDELVRTPETGPQLIVFLSYDALARSHRLREAVSNRFLIPPAFWTLVAQEATGFFGCEANAIANDGASAYCSWFRFMVKHARETPHEEKVTYTWQKVSVFTRWSLSAQKVTLCFDYPSITSYWLERTTYNMDAEGRLDPYFHQVSLVEETVNLFDASVWSLRDLIRNVETSRKLHLDPSKPPKPDFEQLHEISRHVIHSSETLKSAINVLDSMIDHHDTFTTEHLRDSAAVAASRKIKASLQYQLSLLNCISLRSQALGERLQNEITLAHNLVAQYNSVIAQYNSELTLRISEATKSDSTAMRTISVLTLLFLPGTFVCALFSMSFFNYTPATDEKPQHWSVSKDFWIYWMKSTASLIKEPPVEGWHESLRFATHDWLYLLDLPDHRTVLTEH
ncbi:hypothetical protein B0A49_03784 [Cryomyces minteri]|uniref:Nucleolar 27S pre-rRNA processing Urb2/Npa2 C-terminal domain-containing protein n=1 Tax=Cryomyces minteri TaxID=331657 RepID=A0A4U0X9N8_9PEZI|nr:hypothetical protein B0A49_03784 [Cryomyces minteri]